MSSEKDKSRNGKPKELRLISPLEIGRRQIFGRPRSKWRGVRSSALEWAEEKPLLEQRTGLGRWTEPAGDHPLSRRGQGGRRKTEALLRVGLRSAGARLWIRTL